MRDRIKDAKPKIIHQKIASLPISNFIDTTFDRSLYRAIISIGKKPILHDWKSQQIGSWKQSNPDSPNIFFSLVSLESLHPWYGLYEQTSRNSQNRIQIENMSEMLRNKDFKPKKDFLWLVTKKEITRKYKRTILGMFWSYTLHSIMVYLIFINQYPF